MLAVCSPVPTGPGFLAGILGAMDCQARNAAEQSFLFLAAPGALGSILLVTCVTLLIAILAFRLMFGSTVTFGDVTVSAIKIGIALAIATSWPVVSKVIADPAIDGPAELTRWTGITDQLANRLGRTDEGIGALTSWGTGRNDVRAPRTANGDYAANQTATVVLTDALAFGGGRTAFLVGAIGTLGLLKLLAGVLIGLAPIFAGLLLFDVTRGVFVGWLRGLFALTIAGAAANIILAAELMLLEPWLAEVIAQRQSSLATPSAAGELLAMTLAFNVMTMAGIFLIFRTILSLDLGVIRRSREVRETENPALTVSPSMVSSSQTLIANDNGRRSGQTVEALQRIDSYRQQRSPGDGSVGSASSTAADAWSPDASHSVIRSSNGVNHRRRSRLTLSGQRRDRRS